MKSQSMTFHGYTLSQLQFTICSMGQCVAAFISSIKKILLYNTFLIITWNLNPWHLMDIPYLSSNLLFVVWVSAWDHLSRLLKKYCCTILS